MPETSQMSFHQNKPTVFNYYSQVKDDLIITFRSVLGGKKEDHITHKPIGNRPTIHEPGNTFGN